MHSMTEVYTLPKAEVYTFPALLYSTSRSSMRGRSEVPSLRSPHVLRDLRTKK